MVRCESESERTTKLVVKAAASFWHCGFLLPEKAARKFFLFRQLELARTVE